MDKYKEWAKTCLSKKKISDSAARRIKKKAKIKLRYYFCPHCGGCHLTKKESRKTKKPRPVKDEACTN
jgi:hypothetical protein